MLKARGLVCFLAVLLSLPVFAETPEKTEQPKKENCKRIEIDTANKGLVKAGDEVLINIAESVIGIPLADGVTPDDAIESMKLRANALNIKCVGHTPLWEEYKALGLTDIRRTEIFQFCDATIAKKLLDYDINFLAYMPCRVGLIQDQDDEYWLITMNLNVFLTTSNLPKELYDLAMKVRDDLEVIMEAGANGDL
jgi:uncharacterized protein (DUF302 family)